MWGGARTIIVADKWLDFTQISAVLRGRQKAMVAPFAAEECEVDLEDDPSWICMEPHTSAEFNVFYVSPTTCKKLTKSFMSWMQFHFTGILDTTTKNWWAQSQVGVDIIFSHMPPPRAPNRGVCDHHEHQIVVFANSVVSFLEIYRLWWDWVIPKLAICLSFRRSKPRVAEAVTEEDLKGSTNCFAAISKRAKGQYQLYGRKHHKRYI